MPKTHRTYLQTKPNTTTTTNQGRPWMKGMLENHPLFLSVFICIAGVVVASWEMVPQLNDALQLAPFPNDEYRYKVVALVCATIAGTLIWDRLCVWMWGGKVFTAMTEEVSKTTMKDVTPVLATAAKIVVVVLVLGTGNILLGGLGYWYYSSWVKKNYPDPDPPAPGPMSQCTVM